MADDSFKYPPGIKTYDEYVNEYYTVIVRSDYEKIQQDAVTAARREQSALAGEDLQDVDPRNPKGI